VKSLDIKKQIVFKAPLERVWAAISDSSRFGEWFGVDIDGPFLAGQEARGTLVGTKVDREVAQLQAPYSGLKWAVCVDRIEPMRLFSFRWHPGAVDTEFDYSEEPMTLVTFELAEVAGGTQLTITESGFEEIPILRRTKAREGNDAGWTHQTRLIEKYLALEPAHRGASCLDAG
jgi:uncharacterized protein YndB with AHSA1/START domain